MEKAFLTTVLDAFPHPVLVVDSDVRIIMHNEAAAHMLGPKPDRALKQRSGEVLKCMSTRAGEIPCGHSPECRDCDLRSSVNHSFQGESVARKKVRLLLQEGDETHEHFFLITTSPFRFMGRQYVLLTLEDINELMELKNILPICSSCMKIRDDEDYWESVEHYFKRNLDMDFSHGLCPECLRKLYPEISGKVEAKIRAARKGREEIL